jgi:predicted nuclease of predicted toxin-antitoxin system
VRVLVDAHLPIRLSEFLLAHAIESKHTLDLPKKNATPDSEIIRFADDDNRIVISKDSDFLDNYFLDGSPKKNC